MFTQNWDIENKGLTEEEIGKIDIENSGDSKYVLFFNDGNGNRVDLPVGVVESDTFYFGDTYNSANASAKYTVLNESKEIFKNDYFVITDESVSDGDRKSFVMQYKGSDKYRTDDTTPPISFTDVGSGDNIDVTYKRGESIYLKYGGGSFLVENASADTSNDFQVKVDFDADGTIGDSSLVGINTKEGASIAFTTDGSGFDSRINSFSNGVNVTVSTPDADDYENLAPTDIVYQLAASGSSDQVTLTRKGGLYVTAPTGDSENSYGMNSMGTKVHQYSPTSGRPKLYIEYPAKQALPQIFVTAGAVESTESTSGGAVSQKIVPINVGAAKLDSEVIDKVGETNLIVVGGPCANTVAAKLMDNPNPCGKDFKEGESLIKLFENGDFVSLLVAGWEAEDTVKACQVVAKHGDFDNFEGMELSVKTLDGTVTKVEAGAEGEAEGEGEA